MIVVSQDLVRNKDFIDYVKATERYQEVLVKEFSCSHTEIIQYKKNLKRKIEEDFPKTTGYLFIPITLKNILLLKN